MSSPPVELSKEYDDAASAITELLIEMRKFVSKIDHIDNSNDEQHRLRTLYQDSIRDRKNWIHDITDAF
jgi:hypothetical protein